MAAKEKKVARKDSKNTYDLGRRSLILSEELNEDFDRIKTFGSFDKAFFHNFFHSFYSLAVGYGAMKLFNDDKIDLEKLDLESTDLRKDGKGKNSIDSDQLKHHDNFFKVIGYWYLLKKGDPEPFIILCQPNRARQICEGIFNRYWKEFREKIKKYSSSYPNVLMIDIVENK